MSTIRRRGGRIAPLACALLALSGASVAAAAADSSPLVLEHLTRADGLPQGTVYVTLQDSQGFVWLGTEDGLVRYDGHDLQRYAYSPAQRQGLPGNYVFQIVEDTHRDLWIALKDAGVARWNRGTDTFTPFRHDLARPGSLASDAVRALALDSQGKVWIGTTDAGIDVLDPASGSIEHLRHDAAAADTLASNHVLTLSMDHSGTVWVGTDIGLDRWVPGRHGFEHFRHQDGDSGTLSGNQVSRVIEDRSGAYWIATFDGGLNRLDGEGRVVQRFRHDAHEPASLASDDVRALLEDQAGRLWVGTAEGLELLDRATGQFSHYRHEAADPSSLTDSFIMSLYTDQAGLIWIGTRDGGVSRWNPRSWELGGHRPPWLHDKMVTAFADGPANKIWIGSQGGGLQLFDGDTGAVTPVDAITGVSNSIGDSRVMSLRHDTQGNLWIGTMASGLKRLSPDGKVQSIPVAPGDARGLSSAGIMTIFQSRTGQLWVGTFRGGLNVLDPMTGLIRQLPFGPGKPGAISSANVTALAEDRDGNLWIGTDGGGLDLARADGTVVAVFRRQPNNPSGLPANTVYGLAIDAKDRVWVATDGGGLARVVGSASEPESLRFETLSREQGLSSDSIFGVVADAAGRIWLSGTSGLVRYDPETREVKTYHRESGLQGEEFDSLAYFRLRDGRIAFGGPGGFNLFDPLRLTESSTGPRLALTGVEVMGVATKEPKPYWLLDGLTLDYRANVVSLDVGVLDFTSPRRNRLEYRMVGLTDKWIDLGTQHRVSLTNLDSGDHLLEVRAANSDSVWSQTPLRLQLHRDPAPWRSPWAYTVYALIVFGLIAYRVRLQRIRFQRVVQEQQRLETEVALRTRELVETNRQLEEAAQAKSKFLDRMSHELRTPMNGVVGMTELLSRTNLSTTQSRLTHTIRSSAQVLLQIVNDLLDLSKINAGKVALEELPIELGRILEECTSLFAGAAEAKGIDLIVCPPATEPRNLLGDPLRVRQILMNLVGNAVKFTSQGEIVVRVDVGASDANTNGNSAPVQFSVTDSGIGMDAETVGKIFKPFTQADESTTRKFGGTGLGLAICKELTDLMGGTIGVESRKQVGSTFRFTLPFKVGAEQPRRPLQPLPDRLVRIVTRRPALAESLARHVASFGLSVVTSSGERSRAVGVVAASRAASGEIVVVDAGSNAAGKPIAANVFVATSAEAEAQGLATLVDSGAIVLKPVRRDAFYEALAVAMGVTPSASDATQILSAQDAAVESAIGGHLLLVEDEPVNAAVAQGYLSALGCTCVWVKDGTEAVARAGAERFDLILMDLSMPGMDGFATTQLIRQRLPVEPRVPIIALSAHDAGSYREKCLSAGMDDMLSKPCTLEQCATVLRRWMPRGAAAPTKEVIVEVTAPKAHINPLSLVDAASVARLRSLRSDGSSDLFVSLVGLFQSGSSDAMTQLSKALRSSDLRAASAICHKLASSAANVGALSFSKDVRQLEHLCAAGDGSNLEPLFARLNDAYPALIVELSNLQRASA